ncbi:hypothetical protein GGR56DRAFT_674598 [Xylariaceae sp. FL0804]|nr:hypothetical protein GGR56DRAFT_674598 [Xylariaceae sp. FL0804]
MDINNATAVARQHHHQQQQQSQSQQTQPQPQQTPQYTTVGSIWKTQQQPLQPPARRGRTLKTLYQYKSESPSAAAQQYSPLQQNSDRAVSPPSRLLLQRPEQDVYDMFGPALQARASTSSPAVPNVVVSTRRCVDADIDSEVEVEDDDDDCEEDNEAERSLRQMNNIKAWSNLASYANPMQRAARKLIDSHRPSSDNCHRAPPPPVATPLRLQMNSKAARGSQPLQSDGAEEYGDRKQAFRFHPEAPAWGPQRSQDASRSSVLSNGPGAPAPLTAGPPGVRHSASSFQSTIQKTAGLDNITMPNTYNNLSQQTQKPLAPVGPSGMGRWPPAPIGSGRGTAPSSSVFGTGQKSSGLKLTDTLTAEEAATFYPNGFPANFSPATEPVSRDWTHLLDQHCPGYAPARLAQLYSWFYSGNGMIHKTFQQAVSERNHRELAGTLDGAYKEPPVSHYRVANRLMSVEEASEIPTHEHAAPLLSMVFQTLANRPEFSKNTKVSGYDGWA